ncbi:MAG: GSCFA domain-containing protein [Bacteroidales bacterium]|nr:GSCFA domain-containing protein [Bacteroidales bacterium]
MIKLQTPVNFDASSVRIGLNDKVLVVGSCFADEVGSRIVRAGFDACVNPFGTLYNPVSILNSLVRLDENRRFTDTDCVEMGAGAGLICSFSHHTSFAKKSASDFLLHANEELEKASAFWKSCSKVIVSLGTVYCFHSTINGMVVSNCLKRPVSEFERRALTLDETASALRSIIEICKGKEIIFTVSPIRHLADGAHGNQLSKSTLLLAVNSVVGKGVEYFPAYEILLDELRDYRFYAEDMVHPSAQAAEYIWQRFKEFAVPENEVEKIAANEKAFRASCHRPMHL